MYDKQHFQTIRETYGHNSNASDREHHRWGGHKQISLLHLSKIYIPYASPSKELYQGVEYFINSLSPDYITTTPIKDITRNWIKVVIFYKQGTIEGGLQLYTYLLYMAFRGWKTQGKLRDSIRRRKSLGEHLNSFIYQYEGKPYNLLSLLLEEGNKAFNTLSEKGYIPISCKYEKKEQYNTVMGYVSEQEALSNYQPFSYSFDK